MKLLVGALLVLSLAACTKQASNPHILNLATPAKIKGFDPAHAEDQYSNGEVVRVYETLLQYHPFKRPYVLEGLLAESLPTVSKDGLTYTFKIRKGVFFHDDPAFPNGKGRELKAKDFEYSIKRLADPGSKSVGFWIVEGRLKGLDEWHAKLTKDGAAKADYNEVVEGLQALDDYTLQIKLKKPFPQLLNVLAMPYSSAVPKEAVDKYGDEFMNHAVGTGAFILTEYAPGDHMTYKKNPNYWGKFPSDGGDPADAGKQLPLEEGVYVRVIPEEQPRWLHFLKGDIDRSGIPKDSFTTAAKVLDPSKPTSVENIELSEELKKKGVELYGAVGMDFTYTAFNLESKEIPQFKDKRVRQAISLALDEKELIRLFYSNAATSSQTPIPPGINGYDPTYVNPYRTGDIEKAKKLLAEAGYPEGKGFPVIPYDTLPEATSRQMAEFSQKELEKIGLKTTIVANTWPAMLQRIQNRQAQLWGIAWSADYPDAENFLQLFYGPNANPGGMNGSYYKNKAYDELFEKARILQDSPERTAMYKKLGLMIAEDCPVILGAHRIVIGLRQPWIKNDLYDEFTFHRTKYLKIDQEIKKKYGR